MHIVFDWLLRTWLKRYIIFNFAIWLFVLVQTWIVKTILRHWWTFFFNIRQLRFVKKTCVICSFYEFPMWCIHFVYSRYSGGSMSKVISNSSYWPITNTKWVRSQLWKLQKRCTRLTAAIVIKIYQLLADSRWFSPAFSTTKTGRHDIAEILLCLMINFKPENT